MSDYLQLNPTHYQHVPTGMIYVTRVGQTIEAFLAEIASEQQSDPPPARLVRGTEFLSRVTDAEMMAVLKAADGNAQIRRWVEQLRMLGEIDLNGTTAQAAKAGLVAAGLLTQARADLVFA